MGSCDIFVGNLAYFGGAISTRGFDPPPSDFVDLELFFLEATLQMSHETRVTQCFLAWLRRYGVLLSPSKTRRLIRAGASFDPAVLGVFLEIISSADGLKQNWKILRPFVQKAKKRFLMPSLPPPPREVHPAFEKFGIIAYPFSADERKYLRNPTYVLKHCPELEFRSLGVNTVAADLRAYLKKRATKEIVSLYKIARDIHHPRTNVYLYYKLFSAVGSL